MAVTAISRDQGINVSIVRMTASDSLATVSGVGYITAQTENINTLNNGEWEWLATDVVCVSASDGHQFFEFSSGNFATLVPVSQGENVILPVISNHFANFSGTTGTIRDAGYLPSDATKTHVAMLSSPGVTDGGLVVFTDSAGTIGTELPALQLVSSDSATPSGAYSITNLFELTAPVISSGSAIASIDEIEAIGVNTGLIAAHSAQTTILGAVDANARIYCTYNVFDFVTATIDEAQVSVSFNSIGDVDILLPTDLTRTRVVTAHNGTTQFINAMYHADGLATNLFELNNGAALNSYFQIAGTGPGAAGAATYQPAVRTLQIEVDGVLYFIGLYDTNAD